MMNSFGFYNVEFEELNMFLMLSVGEVWCTEIRRNLASKKRVWCSENVIKLISLCCDKPAIQYLKTTIQNKNVHSSIAIHFFPLMSDPGYDW